MPAVRKALLVLFAVGWMIACFVPAFPLMVLFPLPRWRLRVAAAYAWAWSRGCLWAAGIRLEVTGREHLRARPAVFTFNHTNDLDFFANAVITPWDTLVFGKRELARVPFIGWIWLLSGHPMIRRQDRGQWQGVLDRVEARLATGVYRTVIAPEGTRSKTGVLGPFKKGPFLLAAKTKAPIVPWVIHGAADLLGRGRVGRGTLRVEVLPPVDTSGWDPERLDEQLAEVRARYLAALGQQDPAPPPAAS